MSPLDVLTIIVDRSIRDVLKTCVRSIFSPTQGGILGVIHVIFMPFASHASARVHECKGTLWGSGGIVQAGGHWLVVCS